jgi:hypothetical protein
MLDEYKRTPTAKSDPQTEPNADGPFEYGYGELRRALIQGIARRVGKTVELISAQEASSDVPLAELYHRKLHANGIARLVDRLLFRWWR